MLKEKYDIEAINQGEDPRIYSATIITVRRRQNPDGERKASPNGIFWTNEAWCQGKLQTSPRMSPSQSSSFRPSERNWTSSNVYKQKYFDTSALDFQCCDHWTTPQKRLLYVYKTNFVYTITLNIHYHKQKTKQPKNPT